MQRKSEMVKAKTKQRTEEYFRERAARADRGETLRILEQAGRGNAPVRGDELPANWKSSAVGKKPRVRRVC
jgi:hypothetical protein